MQEKQEMTIEKTMPCRNITEQQAEELAIDRTENRRLLEKFGLMEPKEEVGSDV